MPLGTARYVPRDAKVNVVEIDSYEHRCPVGTVYNPSTKRRIPFRSSMEMLLAVEELLDSLNYPQASMAARSFVKAPARTEHGEPIFPAPALAVFRLNVMFRHNASWQGTLLWDDDNQESFKSALELMNLIDRMITETVSPQVTESL